MKDLYKRLNIDSSASPEEIRQALEGISDPGTRARVEKILLCQDRRKVYDRNYRVLMQITELRHRLALYDKECWASGTFGDFTSVAAPENIVTMAERRLKRRNWMRNLGLIGLVVLALQFLMHSGRLGNISFKSLAPRLNPPGYDSPKPKHRTVFYSKALEGQGVPVDISVPLFPEHYLVQLKDSETGEIVLKVFLHAGGTYKGNVPPGSYRVQYAGGDHWLGERLLFGETTIFAEPWAKVTLGEGSLRNGVVVIELRRPDLDTFGTKAIHRDAF